VEQPPDLTWELLEEVSPAGDLRWTVGIINPEGDSDEQATSANSLPLSAFNVSTDLQGIYYWRVLADWQNPQNGEWQPFCEDPFSFTFILGGEQEVPEQQAHTPTTTPTITVQPEQQSGQPSAVATTNLNCRIGPNENYELIDGLRVGETAPTEGRNANGSWLYIQPPRAVLKCWVLASGVETSADIGALPVIPASQIPALPPTPSPPDTTVPQTSCWVWNPNLQKNVCIDPCPPNAQPGGACTQ